jgi:hypothetical protein
VADDAAEPRMPALPPREGRGLQPFQRAEAMGADAGGDGRSLAESRGGSGVPDRFDPAGDSP